MKKLILSFFLLAGCAMQAFAYDFQSGDLLYTIISTDPPQVSLDGHVDGQNAQGELFIPEAVEHNNVTYAVTEIGNMAFFRCIHLTGDLVIPESVTHIGSYAFSVCGIPGTLTLPNSVTEIGRFAFCRNRLTGQLVLPNCIRTIEPGSFAGSEGFTGDLVIPESVTVIGDSAFRLCSFDGRLSIGSNVKRIGKMAFYQCLNLTGDLVIPESVKEIGPYAFYDCGFEGELTLPSQLTAIEDATFAWCSGLSGKLTIPENVTLIGWQAFVVCGFTGDLVIPNKVELIKSEAFCDCPQITSLTIGSAVERIANIAFAGIPLESITLHAETPPSLHYSFVNVPKEIPVYIPCNTVDLYQTAEGWDEFTNFIEDCSLSASEHIEKEVRVLCYPNPTQNQLHLHYPPGVQPTKVELYDLLGHLAYEQHNDLEIIDMQQLPAGKYLLKIMLQDGLIYTNKIVKE